MISAVIPHWPKNDQINAALKRCVASLSGVDEIIVVVNDGIGYAKAVNQGLKLANGDHILVLGNDTEVIGGNIADLCTSSVVVPDVENTVDNMPRAFFCMPRAVYEQIGGFDEGFQVGYFEDDDYIRRLQNNNIAIDYQPSVRVAHYGGMTMRTTDRDAVYEKNKQYFNTKWGTNDTK